MDSEHLTPGTLERLTNWLKKTNGACILCRAISGGRQQWFFRLSYRHKESLRYNDVLERAVCEVLQEIGG